MTRFDEIHEGWTDRLRRNTNWPRGELPKNGFADPSLDDIDDEPGWRYRHGALFRKA